MRNNKYSRINLIFLIIFLLFSIDLYSQVNNRIDVGARPLGMGGAYVGVADDANSIYWNPAGLPFLQRQELTSMYANPYGGGLGMNNSYLGYVFPLSDLQGIGIDWFHFGIGDDELGYRMDKFNLSYGLRPIRRLSLGMNLKMVDSDLTLDKNSIGKSRGYGLDFGLLFTPITNLRFGFTSYDIGGTSVRYDNDVSEKLFKQRLKFGFAYLPIEDWLIACDVGDRFHFGSEYWLFGQIALRAGIQKSINKVSDYSQGMIFSGGFGFKYRFLQIDYAYQDDPELPNTHRFSLSFFYNPALVSIKNAVIKPAPLFRSLYRRYEEEEFSEVILKNSSQKELPVSVSIDVPTLMETPAEVNLILPPQSTQTYPVNVTFSPDILASDRASYDNLVQPVVKVLYMQDRNLKETTYNVDPVYILGKGKISWSIPERVGAFITLTDEVIDRFARTVIQEYNDIIKDEFNNSNLGRAVVLFDALGKHGIVYQADVKTPWYKIAQDSTIFDNIQYPSELLRSKIGDCDDCMALFVSLLENLGIDTIVLDVSAPGAGHIYMMFDSGISVEDAPRNFLSETEYVVYDNRVWIPIETTMYGFSFADAWRNGAEEYHRRKAQGYVKEIDIAVAKIDYKSGIVPAQEIKIPPREIIDELVNTDISINQERFRQMTQIAGVPLDNPDGLYDAGATYLNFNRLDDALDMMQKAIQLKPDFADALNTIGVIYTMKRQYNQAIDYYNRAVETEPDNPLFRMNVAITLYLQGKLSEAQKEYEKVIETDKDYKGLLEFLEQK